MSAFIQSFKLGVLTGLLNNTFGDRCCSFNPISSWRFTPIFTMPRMNLGWFNSYHNNYNMPSCWNFSPPSLTFPLQNYAWENFTSQPLNFYNMQNSWNNFGCFDTFTIQNTHQINDIKAEPVKPEEVVTNYDAQALKTKWNNYKSTTKHLPLEFFEKVISISKELDCDPNDLMGVFNLETAGTFKASEQNKNTKATGLIQFMPDTATAYGTTIDKLAKMSEVEQLDYVKRYLLNWKKTLKIKGKMDATTLYCLVFWPDAAKKENSYIIACDNPNEKKDTYDVNSCLDFNNDKVITRGDLANRIQQYIA